MVFAKVHTAKEKSRTPRAWRDFCWAAFLAGGVFFLSGLMYGVLAGGADLLANLLSCRRSFGKIFTLVSSIAKMFGC